MSNPGPTVMDHHRKDLICESCGEPFKSEHWLQTYCSYKCRQKKWKEYSKKKRLMATAAE